MSDKVYVRMCERFTQWRASKPIEVDVEKLRKCEPPYEGNSHKELLEYLNNEVLTIMSGPITKPILRFMVKMNHMI